MSIKNIATNSVVFNAFSKVLSNYYHSQYGGIILAYHEIDIERFKEHVELFRKHEIVSLSEMVNRKKKKLSTKYLVTITVDDCYLNTLPALCDYCSATQIPITFFVPTDFIEGKALPPFIFNNIKKLSKGRKIEINNHFYDFSEEPAFHTFFNSLHDLMYYQSEKEYKPIWSQIMNQLVEQEVCQLADFNEHNPPVNWDFIASKSKNELLSFQSHTVTHQAAAGLSAAQFEMECKQSKHKIESITNKEVTHFCYPYGGLKNIGNTAPAIVQKMYDSAVTMVRGRINAQQNDYLLPRIPLYDLDTKQRTILKTIIK